MAIQVGRDMSIDKHSNGVPEVNVHKKTTKVNLSVIAGVLVFFAIMGGILYWFARQGT